MTALRSIVENIVKDHLELSDRHTDGTYLYNLTRVKSAFAIGTVKIDDFEEIDLKFVEELVDKLVQAIELQAIL